MLPSMTEQEWNKLEPLRSEIETFAKWLYEELKQFNDQTLTQPVMTALIRLEVQHELRLVAMTAGDAEMQVRSLSPKHSPQATTAAMHNGVIALISLPSPIIAGLLG